MVKISTKKTTFKVINGLIVGNHYSLEEASEALDIPQNILLFMDLFLNFEFDFYNVKGEAVAFLHYSELAYLKDLRQMEPCKWFDARGRASSASKGERVLIAPFVKIEKTATYCLFGGKQLFGLPPLPSVQGRYH